MRRFVVVIRMDNESVYTDSVDTEFAIDAVQVSCNRLRLNSSDVKEYSITDVKIL